VQGAFTGGIDVLNRLVPRLLPGALVERKPVLGRARLRGAKWRPPRRGPEVWRTGRTWGGTVGWRSGRERMGGRSAARATGNRPPRRVFVVVDVHPIYTAGAGSFVDDLLQYARGTNVSGRLHSAFPSVSAEVVERDDPDVIITSPGTLIPANVPPWSRLRAVREHRIVRLNEADLFRAGPRVADVLEALVRAVAPFRPARPGERPGAGRGEVRSNVHRARRLTAPAGAPRRRRSG